MSKAKFDAAKELIQEKKYAEARILLRGIDHPTAREWETKLDKIAPPVPFDGNWPTPPPDLPRQSTTGTRIWRNVWGALALISMGWICYGLYISTMAYGQVVEGASSKATQTGAAIGSSIGLAGFVCTGLPFVLLFLYAYSRAGAAIRSERQHQEMLQAVSKR